MSIRTLHNGCEDIKPEWAVLIASELEQVERKLEATVSSSVAPAVDLSMHLLSAGGKRVRPALVILSALASGGSCDAGRLIDLAASMELVHTASLIHDDVLDETQERRGVKTANSAWGNKLSVLGGDFMLANAFSLLASGGDVEVIRMLSGTAIGMTESEMLQMVGQGDIDVWEESYWQIIRDKTANFMGSCCECGAILGGATPSVRGALAEYGVQLGLAFQITDDILDLAGDPKQTGKEIGTDLVSGKFTLPVLLALKHANENSRRILQDELNDGFLTRERAQAVAAVIVECGAVDLARMTAANHASDARKCLCDIPASDYRDTLESLTTYMIDRES